MKLKHVSSLKIVMPFIEMELDFSDNDKDAAWELCVELLTRVALQPLDKDKGDEKAALSSIYSLFETTRSIVKSHGRGAKQTSRIALIVLNKIIRPFTTKWHTEIEGYENIPNKKEEFRAELLQLQRQLSEYARVLCEIAGVEDVLNE